MERKRTNQPTTSHEKKNKQQNNNHGMHIALYSKTA